MHLLVWPICVYLIRIRAWASFNLMLAEEINAKLGV